MLCSRIALYSAIINLKLQAYGQRVANTVYTGYRYHWYNGWKKLFLGGYKTGENVKICTQNYSYAKTRKAGWLTRLTVHNYWKTRLY